MTFTDPPYNVDYGNNKTHTSHKIRAIENDKQSPDAWAAFNQALSHIFKTFCSGDLYCWGASGPEGMRQRLAFVESGIHWSATIIWKKQALVLSPANYQRIYEPCFYGWAGKSSFGTDRTKVEVWEVDRPTFELPKARKEAALRKLTSKKPADASAFFGFTAEALLVTGYMEMEVWEVDRPTRSDHHEAGRTVQTWNPELQPAGRHGPGHLRWIRIHADRLRGGRKKVQNDGTHPGLLRRNNSKVRAAHREKGPPSGGKMKRLLLAVLMLKVFYTLPGDSKTTLRAGILLSGDSANLSPSIILVDDDTRKLVWIGLKNVVTTRWVEVEESK